MLAAQLEGELKNPVKPLRVLAVVDPALAAAMNEQLDKASGVEVVACVSSSVRAGALLTSLRPDVVVLDLELADLSLLTSMLEPRLAPVVVLSSFAAASSELAVRAVALGAADVIEIPAAAVGGEVLAPAGLADRLRAAARARSSLPSRRPLSLDPGRAATSPRPWPLQPRAAVVAIGASTGGTLALAELLRQLPADAPPLLIVQHMLSEFTREFAARLDADSAMDVREAQNGEPVRPGCALIAPGGFHLRLARDPRGALRVAIGDDSPVALLRPSVDVLFQSCARSVGAGALGVVLTGMGQDGAEGLLELRNAGGITIAQDEASSAVFGMPRAAISCGAAERVLPLSEIALAIMSAARSRRSP
jgi:two-component system chemotaxis response regulator CheB